MQVAGRPTATPPGSGYRPVALLRHPRSSTSSTSTVWACRTLPLDVIPDRGHHGVSLAKRQSGLADLRLRSGGAVVRPGESPESKASGQWVHGREVDKVPAGERLRACGTTMSPFRSAWLGCRVNPCQRDRSAGNTSRNRPPHSNPSVKEMNGIPPGCRPGGGPRRATPTSMPCRQVQTQPYPITQATGLDDRMRSYPGMPCIRGSPQKVQCTGISVIHGRYPTMLAMVHPSGHVQVDSGQTPMHVGEMKHHERGFPMEQPSASHHWQ